MFRKLSNENFALFSLSRYLACDSDECWNGMENERGLSMGEKCSFRLIWSVLASARWWRSALTSHFFDITRDSTRRLTSNKPTTETELSMLTTSVSFVTVNTICWMFFLMFHFAIICSPISHFLCFLSHDRMASSLAFLSSIWDMIYREFSFGK